MQLFIAQHSGFCEGVNRAFRIALDQVAAGRPVFMLGNLVHNKQVVERLNQQGIKTIKNLTEVPLTSQGVLLISAHGVPPNIYDEARQLNLEIVDTTCPWVKKAQQIAAKLIDEGRTIIIIGDKGHPEVQGLIGWSKGRAIILENLTAFETLSLAASTKLGIIAQTTQAEESFWQIVTAVKKEFSDVKEYNTICGATVKRQAAAVALAKQVNLMLIIGDKLSANTKRLTELCAATGVATHQIETANELDISWLTKITSVGISAGASTPEWVIQEVVQRLENQSC